MENNNININKALFRRNNFGNPCIWFADTVDNKNIIIQHGIVGKKIHVDVIGATRDIITEINARYRDKRKVGYLRLSELKDNCSLPVEGELLHYLNAYLPTNRYSIDGDLLPMLAKTFDNVNNKLFKAGKRYLGQYKINGLRCFISATTEGADMFHPIRLKFMSREGTYWNSLNNLEEYLVNSINPKVLKDMLDENYILDGELYVPGYSVNEIDHFVKDADSIGNKLLQFWCYDIAVADTLQNARLEYLLSNLGETVFINKEHHLNYGKNGENRLLHIPAMYIEDEEDAIIFRDKFIDLGFEGLILRKEDGEYQFGKRNQTMIKFKRHTDGVFVIVDIIPEGLKRKNIPLIVCRNDINDETFSCHLSAPVPYQTYILNNKDLFIGKNLHVEYGERSGVKQLPFHIKLTHIEGYNVNY